MPLKIIKPRDGRTPYFSIRGTYLGVRVDRSTKSDKLPIAKQFLKKLEREIENGSFSTPGEPTFASAAASYMKAGGERKYIRRLLEHFGDKPLREIEQAEIDAAANQLYPSGSPATRNRSVYTPISAVWKHVGNTAALKRPRGASGNKATAWLWPEQAEAIFEEAHKIDARFAALLITLCYTGMRLSEALGLTWDKVRIDDGFAYIPHTKNELPRSVFLPAVAVGAISTLERTDAGRVFGLAKTGHLYALLRVAFFRAGVDVPERSAFHIFRHTYATWMRRYAGADSQGLIATGAWKDRKSVDRYTHTIVSEEARRAALLPVPKVRKV